MSFLVKRVSYFSDDNGGSTLGKVAKIAGTTAVGLWAAKSGALGSTLQKYTGKAIGKVGNMVGSQRLINSGANTVAQSAAAGEKAGAIDILSNIV